MTEPRILRIAIAGLGTVGSAVARVLLDPSSAFAATLAGPVRLEAVSARNRVRDRGVDLSAPSWFDDPATMAATADVDVLIELMGGADGPAKATVEAALRRGLAVVTANKALLAAHGNALARLAEAHGGSLHFEAAVAGAIPVIKALRESLAGNQIARVSGILNGTCNYILSRMEAEGLTFAECLKAAQALGYAEADPTFDVEGFDTAHKLAILTALAFGVEVDAEAIYVEGISGVTPLDLAMADELGYRIKLLGVAARTEAGIEQRVHPTMVHKSSQLAQVMGVLNAVSISGDLVRDLTLVGPGAGGDATASSVLADIADIARGNRPAPFGKAADRLQTGQRAPMQRHEGGYYIRLQALDRPGSAATIAARMAERGISLESILQKGRGRNAADRSVPVILLTYATTEALIREAVAAIAADGVLDGPPQVIRMERG